MNYKYIKSLGNHEHLLYSKERFTYEIWESTQDKLRIYAIYKSIKWKNTNLVYKQDYYPLSKLHETIRKVNHATIQAAKRRVAL